MNYDSVLEELQKTGCYTVKGALSKEFVSQVHADLEKLFSLPLDKKLKFKSEDSTSPGFTPYGIEKAFDTGIPNLLEAWEISAASPHKWPENMDAEWSRLVKFETTLYDAAHNFLKSLESELGMPPESLSNLAGKLTSVARYIHYPMELVSKNTEAKRQSMHSDMSLITINSPATSPGLYAFHNDILSKKDPQGGDIVIMPGSILEYVTGNRIKSCKHTVDTPKQLAESKRRISMPFFVMPEDHTVLAVDERIAVDDRYKGLPPVKTGEFIKGFYDTVFHSGNAPDLKP